MLLSDVSIKRPVVCIVLAVLILLVGIMAFKRLPVREYPDIESPVVSVNASYPGAAAEVIETQITDPLEEELSSIDGVRIMRSNSNPGRGSVTLEFDLRRDINEAANDVRDKIGRVQDRLPDEVEAPDVEKADSDADSVLTISMNSDRFSRLELAEIAERVVVQRLQTVPGVSRVQLLGPRFAMRLWVDPDRLAAYQLTVGDIERALRQQNVDIPSGRIESVTREFGMRLEGRLNEVSDYENLVLAARGDSQVKFSDVGRVELGSSDYRVKGYFNGRTTVGVRVNKQTQANLLQLAGEVKALLPEIRKNLPEDVNLEVAYDTSVFVQRSVDEVYLTLYIAGVLVVLTIFVFLRDWRATVIPLVAIPVSIVGSFAVIQAMGFSLNLLTMLALVLAVGLVVDDAIVMLENIYRRIEQGEAPIHASIFGARQMAFAVISTTLTLIAVFVPVAFQSGRTGRLFFEFGITLAVAVSVSSLIALTLTPMLCSRLLVGRKASDGKMAHGLFYRLTEPGFRWLNEVFARMLTKALRHKVILLIGIALFAATGPWFYANLQRELTPNEDRGIFRVIMNFPLGSTPAYAESYAADSEAVLLNTPEVARMFRLTGFGGGGASRGFMFIMLKPWEERERTTQQVIAGLRSEFGQNPGGMIIAAPVRPLGGRRSTSGGVEMVLVGPEFDKLQELAAAMSAQLRGSDVLNRPRISPEPNKPQLNVRVDRARAADMNVPVVDVATTLESLFGGRRVTRFRRGADEYDVLIQVEDKDRTAPSELGKIYLRSTTGALVQLSNLVDYTEEIVPEAYPHLDRQRSISIQAQLNEGYTQGDGVAELERLAAGVLPENYNYTWDGETREYVESSSDALLLFGLALVFTFLILAAQFESWIHPITIFSGVVLALTGGVGILYLSRYWGAPMTDNIFSRFGLIMLIGLVAKNGILIVEFANQLRIEGRDAAQAAYEAATLRFRPILMTAISTILGALPLALATGPGAETRNPMGMAIVGGLTIATFLTLFVIPVIYIIMDRIVMKLTGKSSAHGLVQAAAIEKEVSTHESLAGANNEH
ncbi:efflux RND transporter permease subunit [Synoicihabitans lomoniglobus]|uniref:Efflux RND transporter permease subunit n=1 Tax=Synoicihabitans lomoniglobus TaxID=2909285 RepID=A0AAF0I7G8_9BACT|nr:efflux RND transporter permease subunit [Opitutaceae bacterium LMO-M01]WED66736.1 efflux RND transporter permease subunit [Opitutaceae bacterium LMO-M01]